MYIGEWAFAYCSSMERLSISKDAIIDNNALSNCPAIIEKRNKWDNYLIESDNLFTLKSMQKNYNSKIDLIIIDPPYNSAVNYIGYMDSSFENGYKCFMKKRIDLSLKILSKKGFMVIFIDESEVEELTELCKECFFKGSVLVRKWKKKHPFFDANRVVLNPNKKQTDFEYIIFCSKETNTTYRKLMQPYIENNVLCEKESMIPDTFDCFGTTSSAKDEIKEIFGDRDFFSTPKPVKIVEEIIMATTDCDSLVLDYFAGSGTTGEAVQILNEEDKGSRNFILITNSENDICKRITKKRLEHAGDDFVYLK